MNMWKNTMNLNQHFKHPSLADHNFLPDSELNSFPSWTPLSANNIGHQSNHSTMSHNILDGHHLISGYSQDPRSLPSMFNHQDLVGTSMKGPSDEQASYMPNSINNQAQTPLNTGSSHQTTQPLDNLNLRSQPLDHSASYNLSMNDNQFYSNNNNNNNPRSESRSHPNVAKPSFMVNDRSVHLSMNIKQEYPQCPLVYQNIEPHTSLQPTTSHHVAGSSVATSSKNVSSFKCSTCSEVFSLRAVYQNHIKTHSQDKESKAKFQCELCGHSFSQKTSLNRHMKSHTGERPFPCEICAKAFSEKERLKIHMRTHTGEKPFSCDTCGKSFSQKSTVKRHQTVHTGEKRFRCDCGKGFANRGNLIAHIKTRGANHFE